MWCSNCQQDVPAAAQQGTGKFSCVRCRGILRPAHAVQLCEDGIALDEEPCVASSAVPPLVADDWEVQRQTRDISRKLRRKIGGLRRQPSDSRASLRRLDPPQNLFDDLAKLTAAPLRSPNDMGAHYLGSAPRRPEAGQVFAWLVAFLGAIVLGGGLGLIGWSLYADRTIVWNLAMGLTLAGEGLLVFGLLLVVARLWRNSRYATGKLQEVHADLGQLQRTTEALSAVRGGAPAFYADLVRGASPQILLSNLKGQLDQMATRLDGRL